MSGTYRGFEFNDYLETPWYDREIDLFKAIIDKLPENTETLVTTEHTHAKLVARDGDPDPAMLCDSAGNVILGSGIVSGKALAHVYAGDSGATPDASVKAVIEHSDDAHVGVILPNAKAGGIKIKTASGGYATLEYDDADTSWHLSINGTDILVFPVGDVYTAAWQSFDPSRSGWSGTPARLFRYKQVGKLVWVQYSINGTGDGNNTQFTLPVAAKGSDAYNPGLVGRGAAGANAIDAPMMMSYILGGGSSKVYFNDVGGLVLGTPAGSVFGSGVNKWVCGQFFYEAA